MAVNPKTESLAARYIKDGKTYYQDASLKIFNFIDDQGQIQPEFYDVLVSMFGGVAKLKENVELSQEARNAIFYATSTGYPNGFDEPNDLLTRECQLSLGLIWAALDVKRNDGEQILFLEQALRTANLVITELKKK